MLVKQTLSPGTEKTWVQGQRPRADGAANAGAWEWKSQRPGFHLSEIMLVGLRHGSGWGQLSATLNSQLLVPWAPFHIPVKSRPNTETDKLGSHGYAPLPAPPPSRATRAVVCTASASLWVTWLHPGVSPLTAPYTDEPRDTASPVRAGPLRRPLESPWLVPVTCHRVSTTKADLRPPPHLSDSPRCPPRALRD